MTLIKIINSMQKSQVETKGESPFSVVNWESEHVKPALRYQRCRETLLNTISGPTANIPINDIQHNSSPWTTTMLQQQTKILKLKSIRTFVDKKWRSTPRCSYSVCDAATSTITHYSPHPCEYRPHRNPHLSCYCYLLSSSLLLLLLLWSLLRSIKSSSQPSICTALVVLLSGPCATLDDNGWCGIVIRHMLLLCWSSNHFPESASSSAALKPNMAISFTTAQSTAADFQKKRIKSPCNLDFHSNAILHRYRSSVSLCHLFSL